MMRTIQEIRERFPAVNGEFAFMDNAGGSPVPRDVIDAVQTYFETAYVQVGGQYRHSVAATENIESARKVCLELFGDHPENPAGHVVLGPSTTVLMRGLAEAMPWEAGDQVVVATSGHEANVGPWVRPADRGVDVQLWTPNADGSLNRASLPKLMGNRTKVVAFPYASNLLGSAEEIKPVIEIAKNHGAQTVVDAVAFAPHAPMDVVGLEVDWMVFSLYKVFGPHIGALWGRSEHFPALRPINHFFIPNTGTPYAFEPGGPSHEGCAGINGMARYFAWLAGGTREAMSAIHKTEMPLTQQLLEGLRANEGVRIIGSAVSDASRFPTVSFVHHHVPNEKIELAARKASIGIKTGHFYSYRLCEALSLAPESGVVRISLTHINEPAEVERVLAAVHQAVRC